MTLILLGIALHLVSEHASEEVKPVTQGLLIGAILVVVVFVGLGWIQAGDYCRDQQHAGVNGGASAEYFEEHCDVMMKLDS